MTVCRLYPTACISQHGGTYRAECDGELYTHLSVYLGIKTHVKIHIYTDWNMSVLTMAVSSVSSWTADRKIIRFLVMLQCSGILSVLVSVLKGQFTPNS